MNIVLEELNSSHNYIEYCYLLKQLTSTNPEAITVEQFNKQLEIIKTNPYHKVIVAKFNGKIIATITVLIEPKFIHNISFVAHIEDVVVDTKHRNHGIGSLLMSKAVEIAKEFNCYKIIFDCEQSNINFYKKSEFVTKEHQMILYLDK